MGSLKRDVRRLVHEAQRQGCEMRRAGSGHIKLRCPRGLVVVSSTPSSPRVLKEVRKDLERAGVELNPAPVAVFGLGRQEWLYIGAGFAAAVGMVGFALGARLRQARYGSDCPLEVYVEHLRPYGFGPKGAERAWTYTKPIVRAANHFGVPPEIMAALAHTESTWQPDAQGTSGEVGLVQVMPKTAEELHRQLVEADNWPFGTLDRADPEQSAWLGAYNVSKKLAAGYDMEHALAAYNAGSGRVKPDTPSDEWPSITQAYVPKILERASIYTGLWSHCP